MPEKLKKPMGMVQSADKVIIPVPPKKTNVPRKGKRMPNRR